MAKTLAIFGRQPALGLAELESLFGADKLHPLPGAAILDIEPKDLPLDRLGGTVKACKILFELPSTDWQQISDHLIENVPKHTRSYEPGKLTFGISVYGLRVSPSAINAVALSVKKAVRESGRPVRVVPNKEAELSSAQVLHNHLAEPPLGMELVLVRGGDSTWLAQTFAVQNINAYAARDQRRPKRDARVGMLPPKLAQLIVNLATSKLTADNRQLTVLDPFCGTGVVLQEALLMGYKAYGTDLEPRMIEYSEENLKWLRLNLGPWKLAEGDATNFQWESFDTVAAETYLGRPFSGPPTPPVLAKVMQDVDTIHRKFLKNLAKQTKPGFRACIAIPSWRTRDGSFKHLKVLDSLEELGYTRVSFAHVGNRDLIYHRPNQIVARELVVLTRK
jgi:tRNA G10  N-methylase Trm11